MMSLLAVTDARLPRYAQVEAVLAASIADGTLAPGAQLPAENALVERFGVSRPTVRQAVQNLAARGLVEIRRGTGTFVTHPRLTQDLTALSGFVEDMHALGRTATATVLDARITAATEPVARRLALTTGEHVVRITRVRLADNVPVSFDETYLPLDIGREVMTHDLAVEPIFALLEQTYDIPLVEADYRLEARAAETSIADALGIETGSPLLVIERTTYTTGNRPVDYEILHYRGDMTQFVTRLARPRPRP
jgi:GntR family transcriptional regulator